MDEEFEHVFNVLITNRNRFDRDAARYDTVNHAVIEIAQEYTNFSFAFAQMIRHILEATESGLDVRSSVLSAIEYSHEAEKAMVMDQPSYHPDLVRSIYNYVRAKLHNITPEPR